MKNWRLLDTGIADCYTNMAIDEAILNGYSLMPAMPVLRIYGWHPRAFSIGASQDPVDELDISALESESIDFVRRMTGGGVIFHSNELTYSIVCSTVDIDSLDFVKESYKKICSFIINAYKNLGLNAEFALAKGFKPKKGWFCFAEREKYDIVIDGKKIGGNAQRRLKNIVFQHGSIPLEYDAEYAFPFLRHRPLAIKNRICSLSEALGREIDFKELKRALTDSFEETFNVKLLGKSLTEQEKESAEYLIKTKYNTKDWNFHRDADSAKAARVA